MKSPASPQWILAAVAVLFAAALLVPRQAHTEDEQPKPAAPPMPAVQPVPLGGGGFGGGGFGGPLFGGGVGHPGFAGGGDDAPLRDASIIQSLNTAIVISEKRDRVGAYSAQLGRWSFQALEGVDEKNPQVWPIVGSEMASVTTTDRIYAYSARTGAWDELKVPPANFQGPVNYNTYLNVFHGDLISTFSVQTGQWSTVNWRLAKAVNWKGEPKAE